MPHYLQHDRNNNEINKLLTMNASTLKYQLLFWGEGVRWNKFKRFLHRLKVLKTILLFHKSRRVVSLKYLHCSEKWEMFFNSNKNLLFSAKIWYRTQCWTCWREERVASIYVFSISITNKIRFYSLFYWIYKIVSVMC